MPLNIKFNIINLYQCENSFATNERILDFHYFLYVHNGKGIFKIGNKAYTGTMGDLFYCPPMTGNTIIADDTDPFLLSGIEFSIINEKNSDQTILRKLLPEINIQAQSFLRQSIQKMIEEYMYSKIYSEEVCNNLLSAFIYSILRLCEAKGSNSENMLISILEYIKEGIDRDISHQELSKVFSYHKSSINRMLISATGMSLKNYQIDLRLKKAMELLTYSTKPQNEIASLCGYRSSIFFSRQFKEKVGLTPTEFRQKR